LESLRGGLDNLFSIPAWERDPAMSRWLPRLYEALGYDPAQILEPDFCRRHNGLMLRAGDKVDAVYCAAFPCPEVVEAVLARSSGHALLFLHHPIDMEVAGAGFLPLLPPDLEQMRAAGISIYACHAPLDCHDQIGTNISIAAAFGVQVEQGFARYGLGYAGRIGTIAPATVDELVERGKRIFGLDRVEVGGARPDPVTRLAIVAGGGDDVEVMEEAEALGAQVYITGEWFTRTVPAEEGERRWAEGNRAACRAYAANSSMALLGFSHAASEHLVMEAQMAGWFRQRGLQVECLPQADWWR
jgi:putative NIF3 family GTP cyclohydrolase 1 type 2